MRDAESDGVIEEIASWGWIHWLGVFLSLGIAGINIYIWYASGMTPFLVVGGSFLFGVALFVTRAWHPVLYLLGVLHVGILGVIWFLDGRPFPLFGIANGILSVGIAVVALYLFFEEG